MRIIVQTLEIMNKKYILLYTNTYCTYTKEMITYSVNDLYSINYT